MTFYAVWEIVYAYPDDGGGEYIEEFFRTKEAAEKYCEELNNAEHPDNIRYEVSAMRMK